MIKTLLMTATLAITTFGLAIAHAGPANDKAPQGGNFIYNLSAEPTLLNPLTSTDMYARYVQEWVVESLLQRDEDTYEWAPSLATKWEVSKDERTFTFTLREGVKFHDGKPMTAEDVKFSFDIIFEPNAASAHLRPYYEGIEKVEIVDPKTVRFTAKTKYFQNFDIAAGMTILPKHIYSNTKNKKLNREMWGTGPYKLASYDKGQKLVLE
ncbi:MAG TPA: ABC transporter substrate-binding protein, partial [Bdellovibrionales bacterium]|nr:ABC transporter substrate-binding protein [Bdellovibrionales bacterium]